MSSADRALATIDAGLELAAAPAYLENGYGPPGSDSPEMCWRCDAARAATDVGLCESCRAAMHDEETTAPDPESEEDLISTLIRRQVTLTRRRLLDGVYLADGDALRTGEERYFAQVGAWYLQLPPGPAADADVAELIAHENGCPDCRERLGGIMRRFVDLHDETTSGVLLDAHGDVVGAGPRFGPGLAVPGEPEPQWVVYGEASTVEWWPDGNHWSSWAPQWEGPSWFPRAFLDAVIVDDPTPPWSDPETRERWQERARAYTEEFRVGVWSDA